MNYGFKSPIETAREVIKRQNIESAPVDVTAICNNENIQIAYVDFSEIERRTKKDISGAIRKDSSACVIFVNERDINTRARFTIAHELGHYYLHMDDCAIGNVITSFRMDQSRNETQANMFAAELLMPEELVRAEYAKMVIPVSDSLAKIFNVSKQAMKIRLDKLELLYV